MAGYESTAINDLIDLVTRRSPARDSGDELIFVAPTAARLRGQPPRFVPASRPPSAAQPTRRAPSAAQPTRRAPSASPGLAVVQDDEQTELWNGKQPWNVAAARAISMRPSTIRPDRGPSKGYETTTSVPRIASNQGLVQDFIATIRRFAIPLAVALVALVAALVGTGALRRDRAEGSEPLRSEPGVVMLATPAGAGIGDATPGVVVTPIAPEAATSEVVIDRASPWKPRVPQPTIVPAAEPSSTGPVDDKGVAKPHKAKHKPKHGARVRKAATSKAGQRAR